MHQHQRWLQPVNNKLLNNVSISAFILKKVYDLELLPTSKSWSTRLSLGLKRGSHHLVIVQLSSPLTSRSLDSARCFHHAGPSKPWRFAFQYCNIFQIGHFSWMNSRFCSSMCHWCSCVANRLFSYVKETYFSTV